jgi:hypothetical protein
MVLTRWLERFSNIALEEYIIGVQLANGYTPIFFNVYRTSGVFILCSMW